MHAAGLAVHRSVALPSPCIPSSVMAIAFPTGSCAYLCTPVPFVMDAGAARQADGRIFPGGGAAGTDRAACSSARCGGTAIGPTSMLRTPPAAGAAPAATGAGGP